MFSRYCAQRERPRESSFRSSLQPLRFVESLVNPMPSSLPVQQLAVQFREVIRLVIGKVGVGPERRPP